ncbi:hypothetical protein [Ferrovibrio xuzhouensis]|uniref:Uncharacterized protein n=1 Tax=Ferrovibrio xuzhouensis TaxID=1576914 RepID=A0ABV7VE75_9PROT
MTIRRLEDFARSVAAAVGLAQKRPHGPGADAASDPDGAEAQVTGLDVDLAATVEQIDSRRHGVAPPGVKPGALALRIGQTSPGPGGLPGGALRLSIGVRGAHGEQIEVRLDGKLLGHYGTPGHEKES